MRQRKQAGGSPASGHAAQIDGSAADREETQVRHTCTFNTKHTGNTSV